MKKKFTLIALVILAAVGTLFFIACRQTPEKEIEITVVDWLIENIDQSFWGGDAPASYCFIDFNLQYTGSPIELADIEKVYIKKDDVMWDISLDANSFSAEDHLILSHLERLTYNLYIPHSIAIGTYNFEVKLTNGYSAVTSFTVPAPGSTTTQGFTHVYTEDLSFSPPSAYTPMLKRAIISGGGVYSEDTITVNFSSADNLLYSGRLLLYSAAGDMIGISDVFRNYYGPINAICNSGNALYNNGANNQINVNAANISFFDSSNTMDDIAGCSIFLTDGAQYAGTSYIYNCCSYSAIYSFD